MARHEASQVGQEIAEGRYEITARLGEGSMGQVFRAVDRRLHTDVVIKFPIAEGAVIQDPELLKRFSHEISALVRLSHPHIVRVIDVGEHNGYPYVVMQYLSGGSLKTRADRLGSGDGRPLPPLTLKKWLPAIAKALDFLHGQNHVHRDVKPANILFDQHGNAFLADLGLTKPISGTGSKEAQLTAAGYVLGTPNYLAPEVIMGKDFGPRADQYSLAMTIHEVLVGHNVMEGPTASATLVNQTRLVPPPPSKLVPGVPEELSRVILRGLEKSPDKRFDNCTVLAREVLTVLGGNTGQRGSSATIPVQSTPDIDSSESRFPACPRCGIKLPIGPHLIGKTGRCAKCRVSGVVARGADGRIEFRVSGSSSDASVPVLENSDGASTSSDSIPVLEQEPPRSREHKDSPGSSGEAKLAEKTRGSGPSKSKSKKKRKPKKAEGPSKAVIYGGIVGLLSLLAGSAWFFLSPSQDALKDAITWRDAFHRDDENRGAALGAAPGTGATVAAGAGGAAASAAIPGPDERVALNVAHAPEQAKWLRDAVSSFEKTDAGKRIRVNLREATWLDAIKEIVDGPGKSELHVWSPSTTALQPRLERQWSDKRPGVPLPILKTSSPLSTPLVFLMWKEQYQAFLQKYGEVSFRTIAEAMSAPLGWAEIANKPEWGPFHFGHATAPIHEEGVLSLLLMAHQFTRKDRDLTVDDVRAPTFKDWQSRFEEGVQRSLSSSAANMSSEQLLSEMLDGGPSRLSCILVPENLAVERILAGAGKEWDDLQICYPKPGAFCDNPYIILDVPWSTQANRTAAQDFLNFLKSAQVRQKAIGLGFRPGSDSITAPTSGTPLSRCEPFGAILDPRPSPPALPKSDVLNELLIPAFERLAR